ncbi:hypothetical protein LX36DRAFT_654127, partial [Colletotrichum falcatum]
MASVNPFPSCKSRKSVISANKQPFGPADFDFGEERLRELTAQSGFPWLPSNAFRAPRHGPFGSIG